MGHAPETLEGWYALHDLRRFDWTSWRALPLNDRAAALSEAVEFFTRAERVDDAPEGSSALFTILGHKGDLLVLHFRPTLEALHALETGLARLALARYLTPASSFVSVVELSQHAAGPGSGPLPPEVQAQLERRLKPAVPSMRYVCFYPMNKRRGEQVNWFTLPPAERAELMKGHGMTGRKYAGKVVQVITGAMGLDDWEWGVTLFADDPLQFKKLVYEMRFDEVSARYAEFGPFVVGLRVDPRSLPEHLAL
jgi:chlorite dismutase